jgi:hypothetical protein
MRNRTLSLKRESLAELSGSELVSVAGGQQDLTHLTCNMVCISDVPTYARCPTIPLDQCPIYLATPLTGTCTT